MYCFTVLVFSLIMIYGVAPKYGRKNPIVYISICSLVGSVSIMAVKGFGVAVKLTFAGNNQFGLLSTYVFMFMVAGCIVVQMNYFNKALDTFSTNVYVLIFSPMIPAITDGAIWFRHTQCQPNVLRRVLVLHDPSLLDPLPGIQHHRRDEHHLTTRRVHSHVPGCTPFESFTCTRAYGADVGWSFEFGKWVDESEDEFEWEDVIRWLEWEWEWGSAYSEWDEFGGTRTEKFVIPCTEHDALQRLFGGGGRAAAAEWDGSA